MSGKSRAVVALAAAGTAVVIAAAAAAIAAGTSGAADSKSRVTTDPTAVTVHRSTQDPDQVRRYWTPERLKQANENTRSRTGSQF